MSEQAHGTNQVALVAHAGCAGNPVPDSKQKEQLRSARAVVAEPFPRDGRHRPLLRPEESDSRRSLSSALRPDRGNDESSRPVRCPDRSPRPGAPSIAITFHDVLPDDGVPRFDEPMSEPTEDGRSGRAAAPCVFWMHAHERTFDTVAEDHGNCSVGGSSMASPRPPTSSTRTTSPPCSTWDG